MAMFLATIKFTEKGIRFQRIRKTLERVAAFRAIAKNMGLKATGICWDVGYFDGIIVFEAPDDLMAAAAVRHLSVDDYIQTITNRITLPISDADLK